MKEKIMVSKILNIEVANKWHDIEKDGYPKPGERVVIRFYSPSVIVEEKETEVIPLEEAKIAKYVVGYHDNTKGRFIIDPPYPLFDYSPLSNKGDINNGCIVSHWRYPSAEEINSWDNRFTVMHKYDKLLFTTDHEHMELAYRSFIWAAAYIRQFVDGEDANNMVGFLDDLITLMDHGSYIENGFELKEGTSYQELPEVSLLESMDILHDNIMNVEFNDLSSQMLVMLSNKLKDINGKMTDLTQSFLSSKCKIETNREEDINLSTLRDRKDESDGMDSE